MSLGLPPNIIDSITFRGSVHFYYTYRRLHYHTSVVIYRLIACTVLVPKSGTTNELVIREQRISDGATAVASSFLGGDGSWCMLVVLVFVHVEHS